jgi:hypothetical protein
MEKLKKRTPEYRRWLTYKGIDYTGYGVFLHSYKDSNDLLMHVPITQGYTKKTRRESKLLFWRRTPEIHIIDHGKRTSNMTHAMFEARRMHDEIKKTLSQGKRKEVMIDHGCRHYLTFFKKEHIDKWITCKSLKYKKN